MERPKKVKISFLLLILLFTLTQTAFMFSATLSYDNLSADVQGQNIQIETEKNTEILQLQGIESYGDEGSNMASIATIASTLLSDDVKVYHAEPEINLSVPKLDTINAELTVVDDVDTAIVIAGPEVAEPTPAPIKSVVKHVNANLLNVRSEPTSQSELVTSIKRGDKVTYYETIGDWARIITWNDQKGYVLTKRLVDSASKVEQVLAQQPVVEKPKETVVASRGETEAPPISTEGQTLADKIIVYAKTFLGVPYVYGGYSPKGLDCSGFTKYVFAKYGVSLPRSAREYASIGTKVSLSELQKGDILMWDSKKNGTIGHVGIYMGGGTFIHASSSKGKIVSMSLSTYNSYARYMGARRVLK